MFDQITIIGCGLIGSSLLRAINKKKLSKQVNVFDKSKEVSSFIKNNLSVNFIGNIQIIYSVNINIIFTILFKSKCFFSYQRIIFK